MENIFLRPAKISDAELMFDWRNALETRRYFFDPRPLNKADHFQWFEQSLQTATRCLLIAEKEHKPIGVLRYDLAYTQAEIDIYLNPECAGKGLGTQILLAGTEWIKQHFPQVKTLQAKVIIDNIASLRVFEKAGFNLRTQVYELNIGNG